MYDQSKSFLSLNVQSNLVFCELLSFRFNSMTSLTTVTDEEKKRYVIINYMFECGIKEKEILRKRCIHLFLCVIFL